MIPPRIYLEVPPEISKSSYKDSPRNSQYNLRNNSQRNLYSLNHWMNSGKPLNEVFEQFLEEHFRGIPTDISEKIVKEFLEQRLKKVL